MITLMSQADLQLLGGLGIAWGLLAFAAGIYVGRRL